ncbi:MAG TPA: RpiB/LacA/LacB family sugar-phosphate isomerase [Gaiellaceae bacterium]|nr:RpiB/LacA/LacB family sugar-phosphate isomerase [Gaiellaceae bacterium]
MRVAVAFDHRGVVLRERLLAEIHALGHEVVDLGTDAASPRVDYPDKAAELAQALTAGSAERGILVCSSGVGAAIAACKFDGIRASVCHDVYTAHQGVEHDDMNVLCLGSEIVGGELAGELARTFLAAAFDGGERYRRRLEKIQSIESNGSRRIVHDISVPIRPGMHVYSGNPGVTLSRHESIADGAHANVSRLDLGVHSGTHVDGALHFIDGAAGTEALPLETLVGPVLVVDATGVETDLDEDAVKGLSLGDAERVLLKTRNSELWELPEFTHDFIRLTGSGARYLIDRGVRLVGIDYLSIGDVDAHRELLGAGVVAVEGLDLRAVEPGPYELVCLPIRLEGSDGAPSRAILMR